MLSEYAALVLKLSLFVGIAINIAHPKQMKTMRLSLGIILLSAIMIPIVDIIQENDMFFDISEFVDIENIEIRDETIEEAFEEGIGKYICSEYGLEKDNVLVMADGFDFSSVTAKRIYVTLTGKGVYIDYRRLENDLAREFTKGGECKVELDIG